MSSPRIGAGSIWSNGPGARNGRGILRADIRAIRIRIDGRNRWSDVGSGWRGGRRGGAPPLVRRLPPIGPTAIDVVRRWPDTSGPPVPSQTVRRGHPTVFPRRPCRGVRAAVVIGVAAAPDAASASGFCRCTPRPWPGAPVRGGGHVGPGSGGGTRSGPVVCPGVVNDPAWRECRSVDRRIVADPTGRCWAGPGTVRRWWYRWGGTGGGTDCSGAGTFGRRPEISPADRSGERGGPPRFGSVHPSCA
jgi:hypothetical protein